MSRLIEWSTLAVKQFDQLINYLQERNPTVARRTGVAIFAKLEYLAQFPEAHRQIASLPSAYREALVENYRLLYSLVGSDKIRLISIRHVRQRPLTPLDILNLSD